MKIDINVNFEDIQINNIYEIKFLGFIVGNNLSWKQQIEQLTSKLSYTGYSIRSLKLVMSQEV